MDNLNVRIHFPDLSAVDRILLAEKIVLIDGVANEQAHRQIEELMSADWGGPGTARPIGTQKQYLEDAEPSASALDELVLDACP